MTRSLDATAPVGRSPSGATLPPFRFIRLALLSGGALACLGPGVTSPVALMLGAALGLTGTNLWRDRTKTLARHVLQLAIIGLGAGMNLAVIWSVGSTSAGYTFFSILLTFAVGLWLSRKLGLSRNLGILLTSGTAICGGSAIVAVAGTIVPKDEETSIALATVFALNAVALLIFPTLGHVLGLTQHEFGLWAALAIHDTSSVVGAGAVYGEQALKVATTVKLVRALWIVPLAVVLGWIVMRSQPVKAAPRRWPVPWFIAGFVAAAAAFTFLPPLQPAAGFIAEGAKRLLLVALFLIGASLSSPALRATGWRPLVMGVALWAVVSVVTVAAIQQRWIR